MNKKVKINLTVEVTYEDRTLKMDNNQMVDFANYAMKDLSVQIENELKKATKNGPNVSNYHFSYHIRY